MFKTNPVLLKELLEDVDSRKIQLPDFQRAGCGTTTAIEAYWPASQEGFRLA